MLVGRGIQYLSQFAMVVLLPKALLPKVYAELNLLLPLAYLGVTLVFGWLTGAIHRHVYDLTDSSDPRYKQTIFVYYGYVSLALLASFFVISAFTDSNYRLIPLLLIAAGLRDAVLGVLNMGSNHKGFFFASLGFAASLAVFVGLCFSTQNDDLARYLMIYAALDIVLAITAWRLLGVVAFKPSPRFDIDIAARYFRYGLPLVAKGLPLWIISVSDRYLLSIWQPADVVAGYILSYQLAGSIVTVPMTFAMAVIFPKIIRIDREQGEKAALAYTHKLLSYYLRYSILIFVAACAVVLPIKWYFYAEYLRNPVVVTIIILAHVIFNLSHFYNKEFELNGRTYVITRAVAVGAFVNFGLNLILIPLFGARGAAFTTLVAYSVTVWLVYKARQYRPGDA